MAFCCALFCFTESRAQMALIRDAETEKFLHELADPVFRAANLNPNNIRIFVVNDNEINAFVSGGQNVFINTGLIRKYETPDALIGVLAHETGHIAAGHIARSSEAMSDAGTAMMLSYLLGIGAMLSGSPSAGQAILLGGSQTTERLFMKFTREQEEAADKHAAEYLTKIQYPADGLLNLLEFFSEEMSAYNGQIDEYLLSHPVSQKRIDFLKNNFVGKKFSDQKINRKLQPLMNRVLAKLEGFIDNPDYLLKKYANRSDDYATYVKAVAFYRKSQSQQALNLLDKIIAKDDKNGFLYEMRAQILFESGNVSDAIIFYQKAIKLLEPKDAAQAKISFAAAILTLKQTDSQLINLAVKRLKEAEMFEDDNPFLFRELSLSYNKINDEARSYAALAEYNFLIGNKEKSRKYIDMAKDEFKKLPNKNAIKPELTRLDDLFELTKEEKKN